MADKDLTLRLRMDKSQADRASAEFHAAEKARTAKTGDAHEDATGRGVRGYRAMGDASALMQVGLSKALETARLFGQTMEAAAEKSRALASKFSGQREALGELADLMGRPADNAFTLDIAKFNKATGFKPDEGRAFLTALYNAGAQYKGMTMPGKEFDQYAIQTGKLALALKIKQDDVADVAGSMLGFTDFGKFGDQASEQALAMTARSLKIMQSGQGEGSVMARQFKMLASASLNEDALKGAFTRPEDVAIATSIGAEKHDAQAAELAKIAIRAMRGFGEEQGPILKEAGIGPGTPFLDAIPKLAKVVEAKAKAQGGGIKMEDVLRQNFGQAGAVDALSVFMNKASLIDVRREGMKAMEGTAPTMGILSEYDKSERAKLRTAQADVELAEAERGAENSRLEILRTQARADLFRRGEIDAGSMRDALGNALPFSLVGSREQAKIDEEVQRGLIKKAGRDDAPWSEYLNFSPLAREQDLNRRMGRMDARGIDPLTGGPAAGDPANAEMLQIEKERRRDEKNATPRPIPGGRPIEVGRSK